MAEVPEYREFTGTQEGFEEIERKYSDSKKTVAVVGQRTDGTYTYFVYKWDITDWEYIGEGYWSPSGIGGFFQDLDSAKTEAYLNLLI
ncbi:hypothetical protein Sbal195_2929 [Shewanella baltica OS195]|uniref:Uncharacterized protein n=1 Tax=Shewanella baltica (strain OS195) TaxID=399599 RepID=A9KUS7_SHEB9|nr:hypothetical protein [Shewanella baltica]ABX50095.1 hypothetical protein Sbal195_2929 [Shewanella baltica OS195]